MVRQLDTVDRSRITGRETESERTVPACRDVAELDVDTFVDGDWTVAETDGLAEGTDAGRPAVVRRQHYVRAVCLVEVYWCAAHCFLFDVAPT